MPSDNKSAGKGSRGIIVRGGRILLVLSKHNTWFIPGGEIEKGESAEDALKRELSEEINVNVKRSVYIGAKNEAVHWGKTEIWNYFLVEDYSGTPERLDLVEKEVLDLVWVRIEDMKHLLNLGWQTIDGIYFLAKRFPEYLAAYDEIKRFYDTRQYLSNPEPFFSEKQDADSRTADKMQINAALLSKLKAPIAILYPPNMDLINEVLKKNKNLDILEVNPSAIRYIEKRFGKSVSMLDGVLDIPIVDKKYKTILAIGCLGNVRYFPNFAYNMNKFLEKGGLLVSSLDGARKDIVNYDSFASLLKVYGFAVEMQKGKVDKLIVASKL